MKKILIVLSAATLMVGCSSWRAKHDSGSGSSGSSSITGSGYSNSQNHNSGVDSESPNRGLSGPQGTTSGAPGSNSGNP